jgi:hypothetical protein
VRPLTLIAIGLAAVAVDIRTEYFDMLPDALAWGLVALGAWRLSLTGPASAAGAAALLSLPEVSLPYRYVEVSVLLPGGGFDTSEQLVFDDLTGWRLAAVAAATIAGGVALWLLLGALGARAATGERLGTATQIRWLRWLTLGVWVVPYLVVVAVSALGQDGSFDPVWNGGLEYLALAGVVAVAALVVMLLRESNRAWAVPGWSDRPTHPAPGLRHQPRGRADGRRPA